MRSLLRLFVRFSGFFLFVLLEGICFYLVVQFNTRQSQIWFSSANAFIGAAYDSYDATIDYFGLNKEIERLSLENARLRRELRARRPEVDTVMTDTAFLDTAVQIYSFIPAEVINNSVNRNNNRLTLDKGRAAGLAPEMGVINEDGVVGIVLGVSEHYATVMSILHRQMSLSVSIKRNGYFGSLVWVDNDPQFMELQAIPKYVQVVVGDTIQTSGYSSIFPAGIDVGVVDSFKMDESGNFFEIKIRLHIDMGKIEHTYVVKNLRKEELDRLTPSADE